MSVLRQIAGLEDVVATRKARTDADYVFVGHPITGIPAVYHELAGDVSFRWLDAATKDTISNVETYVADRDYPLITFETSATNGVSSLVPNIVVYDALHYDLEVLVYGDAYLLYY